MMYQRCFALTLVAIGLSGCSSYFARLGHVGEEPALTAIENPVTQPGYHPVSMPMPVPAPPTFNSNSLWRSGSRAFFKDQRAARVGDILTVLVDITDKAQFDNELSRDRDAKESEAYGKIAGYERWLKHLLPKGADVDDLVSIESAGEANGKGSIERQEKITTRVAAVVTQVLPNGNMVIEGRQEIRVNFEKRDLIVAGVVRPEDITSENTIPISKIAEARVSYGGKGRLTDVQQPRYGQQILDILLPF